MAVGFGLEIAIAPPVVALEEDDMGYIVSFDSQGGSFVPAIGVVTGSAIGTLPTPPMRTGYIFAGWFTTPNTGGVEITVATVPSSHMNAYARWTLLNLPIGECRMSADSGASNPVAEGSSKTIEIAFFDEAGTPVIPSAVNWSLYTRQGVVVNFRSSVSVTPGSVVRIVLSGADHATTAWKAERVLVVRATYTSTDGAGLPLVGEFCYAVDNIIGA